MTDRIPGVPGQFQGVITAEALAAMQAGKSFPITLTRDDRPVVEGTPYSKAAVLPDALAQSLCPDIADPTPADAFAALHSKTSGLPQALAALLPKSGGEMTGNIDMGQHSIYSAQLFNGAQLNTFHTGAEDTEISVSRRGAGAYLIFGKTPSGPCLYLCAVEADGSNHSVNKLFGAEYAVIIDSRVTADSFVFRFPKYSCGAVLGCDDR